MYRHNMLLQQATATGYGQRANIILCKRQALQAMVAPTWEDYWSPTLCSPRSTADFAPATAEW